MPKLFALTEEGLQLQNLIQQLEAEAEESGELLNQEVEKVLYDSLIQNEAQIEMKLQGAVMLIKDAEAEAKARKEAAQGLQRSQKTFENRAASIKNLIRFFLTISGNKEHKAGIFKVRLQNNAGEAPLIVTRKEIEEGDQEALGALPEAFVQRKLVLAFDPNDQEALAKLPAEFVRTELVLDRPAVRAALDAPSEDCPVVNFAVIGERGTHVRIS